MTLERSAFRMGMDIAQAFESRSISYALGGALAYSTVGIPRATVAVDMNIFVDAGRWGDVIEALKSLGAAPLDEARFYQEASERGMFETWIGGIRIDVFTPSLEFSWEAEKTRVKKTIDGHSAFYLSAEALAVFKLLFFRTKDIVDLERLISVQGKNLDCQYVRHHISQMMGEDDARPQMWNRLVREFSS